MKINFTVLFLFIFGFSQAQDGFIKGTVTDAETGEAMIGVSILVENTNNGSSTNLDGKFSIEIEPGTYTLVCTYISYSKKIVKNVLVTADKVTVKNITLKSTSEDLGPVEIEARENKRSENAIIMAKRRSTNFIDGGSGEEFSKLGLNNAVAAAKNITGISIEGGKYVYVRGLGDRYSKTTLNNAEIPSLDPNKNSVQMDLFPSNLLDNIMVYKTFSPDLPGSFSGGYINLNTKDFPDEFTVQFTSTFGFNDQASFNSNFLTYDGGKTDFLGFDDGTREIPNSAQTEIPGPFDGKNNNLTNITKSFNKTFSPTTKSPFLDQNYSFSIGNQKEIFKSKNPFGYIASITYRKNNQFYDDGFIGRYNVVSAGVSSELNNRFLLNDQRSQESVLMGGMFNANYKINQQNTIGFTFLRNQSGQNTTRILSGQWDDQAISDNYIFTSRNLQYLERAMNTFQLKGEHIFRKDVEDQERKDNNIELDWISSFTKSKQDEPDLRFFASDYQVTDQNDTLHQINSAAYAIPARYWREMNEINLDNKFNITYPILLKNNEILELKTGAAFLYKNREFRENRFDYEEMGSSFNGNIETYISDENIRTNGNGIYVEDASELRNSYNSNQNILGIYLMGNIPLTNRLKMVTGVRYERTDMFVESLNPNRAPGELINNDILPALNFTYEWLEKVNIRFGYGRTLARPNFREIAPFEYFKFTGGETEIGNPELERTLIDNFDFRIEKFPKIGEYLSASVFYKVFQNPIAKTNNPEASNLEIQFVNVPKARVYGIELEVKKNLDFLKMPNFKIGANASFIKSVVDVAPEELAARQEIDPSLLDTRPMFAQSPYLANAYLIYQNDSSGFQANINFNIFGDRLALVSRGALPDVYEKARPWIIFEVITIVLSLCQMFMKKPVLVWIFLFQKISTKNLVFLLELEIYLIQLINLYTIIKIQNTFFVLIKSEEDILLELNI